MYQPFLNAPDDVFGRIWSGVNNQEGKCVINILAPLVSILNQSVHKRHIFVKSHFPNRFNTPSILLPPPLVQRHDRLHVVVVDAPKSPRVRKFTSLYLHYFRLKKIPLIRNIQLKTFELMTTFLLIILLTDQSLRYRIKNSLEVYLRWNYQSKLQVNKAWPTTLTKNWS
jgi:hypothetical protein